MKYKGIVSFFSNFLFAAIIIFSSVKAFPYGFSANERETMNLQTFIVSDFGDEKDQSNNIIWKSRFSKFAKPSDNNKEINSWDTNACNAMYIEAKPLGLPQEVDSKQKWSLGIKSEFVTKGYNWIEVYPVKATGNILDANGKPNNSLDGTNTSLNLLGVVKSLDMWVWGGNYNYWIEFYLLDYKGFLHRLTAGDINYVGWKNLRTKVPDYIPQAERHVPFLKSLKLDMIKLWSYPMERVDQFYCYFDYLQVQTDVYLERFNGDDLSKISW